MQRSAPRRLFWTSLALVIPGWFFWRRAIRVPCELDLESTHEHLHAHVDLRGVNVDAGDAVTVQGAPASVPFGERQTIETEAVVERASLIRRLWTRATGLREFHELYDVGFEGG